MIKPLLFLIHGVFSTGTFSGKKLDVLGNFCWCEFHLFSPK